MVLPLLLLALPESWRVEQALGDARSRMIEWAAIAVGLSGLALRCVTVAFAPEGTSSRDTRGFRAPSLNSTGTYSLVRHPLYLGGGLMWLGVAMSLGVWWLVLLVALAYWLYVERLMLVEENFLDEQFGEQFRRWAAQTPAFIPSLSGWRPADTHAIHWRRVLSEHNGLLGLSFAMVFLQVLKDVQGGGEPWAEWYGHHSDLVALLGFAIVVSIVCIVVRRRTVGPKQLPEAEPL